MSALPDGSHDDPASKPARPDRRARRRQETIEEILDIALEVMAEEGVNGLTFSEVARRLGAISHRCTSTSIRSWLSTTNSFGGTW